MILWFCDSVTSRTALAVDVALGQLGGPAVCNRASRAVFANPPKSWCSAGRAPQHSCCIVCPQSEGFGMGQPPQSKRLSPGQQRGTGATTSLQAAASAVAEFTTRTCFAWFHSFGLLFCGKPLLIPAWLWPGGWDLGKDLKPPRRRASPTSELPRVCASAAARCPGHRLHFSPGAPESPARRDKTDTPGEMATQTSPPPAPRSSWPRAGLGLGRLHTASALPRGRLQPQLRRTPRHRSCARQQPHKKAGVGREGKRELAFYVLLSHLPQASLRNDSIPALQIQNKGRVAPGWHEPIPSRARFYTSTSTPCHQHPLREHTV